MWIPIHFLTFGGVVPQHLRVHFTAVCSFFTLAAMSALQGRLEKRRVVPATEARQSKITRPAIASTFPSTTIGSAHSLA